MRDARDRAAKPVLPVLVGHRVVPLNLDRAPANEDEIAAVRTLIRGQAEELRAQGAALMSDGAPVITCPCGRRTPLANNYRCRQCGLWFCPACAARHFGTDESGTDATRERHLDLLQEQLHDLPVCYEDDALTIDVGTWRLRLNVRGRWELRSARRAQG